MSHTHDALDQQVANTLKGSWLGAFLTELFQGVSQIALFLLLLEAIWEWGNMFNKPDVVVLLVLALGQSAWLAQRRQQNLTNPWWTRLVGVLAYAVVESLIEGWTFFVKPKHLTFMVLTLLFVWGLALETQKNHPVRAMVGTVLARSVQGIGPLFFYIALDLRDQDWFEGVDDFFKSAPHAFLLALTITQIGALIALTWLARRQRAVIGKLLEQLKTLSRWGFGSHVVEEVLRDSGPHAASRVERAIGFIDIRGFTAWSEAHPPEAVIDMLNGFYAAVLQACGSQLIKSKMSGDEVLLVLPANDQAEQVMRQALQAAMQATARLQLTAGAGLWIGPVVEGFFGAQDAQIHDVIGDTVNTAKRLCDHAAGGELLAGPMARLSEPTAEHISIQAKGKQQPVRALRFQVLLAGQA
ncbi:adenylate/guanylate cyclase domain-containing protein [Rhodoferax sp.]|uniref:adenylate/guanylate cyclase domain-containing protein n=1 Tax=Rhodoferax sp. TaxID=50421 RepID=UPI0026241575|nr:adenylate/guanylate cyclase domain-containing protein [Rhodoferax sp.]MDD2811640.1 adenylate/guanylate cyclase domain-containing protein [Rhodoferax sp.]MDD4944298.1 adenylate/guanylate cyclase domain-containing protein [Rhodoferax sp.]